MFIRWRTFSGDDEGAAERMEEAEKKHRVIEALRGAMTAGRQYGTGIVAIMSMEAPSEDELMVEQIREGDLKALQWFDRYDCSVYSRDNDLFSPTYGDPTHYDLHPTHGGVPIRVHRSRILRFDGIRPPTKSGFTTYDQDFGVSESDSGNALGARGSATRRGSLSHVPRGIHTDSERQRHSGDLRRQPGTRRAHARPDRRAGEPDEVDLSACYYSTRSRERNSPASR